MSAPRHHTADEAAALLSSGALTSVELAEFYLNRISELNPELHAVIVAVDESTGRASAVRRHTVT